jgi:hypothetical protein
MCCASRALGAEPRPEREPSATVGRSGAERDRDRTPVARRGRDRCRIGIARTRRDSQTEADAVLGPSQSAGPRKGLPGKKHGRPQLGVSLLESNIMVWN